MQTISSSSQRNSKRIVILFVLFLRNLLHLAMTIDGYIYFKRIDQGGFIGDLLWKLDLQVLAFWMVGSLVLLILNVALFLSNLKKDGVSSKFTMMMLTVMLMFQMAIGVYIAIDVSVILKNNADFNIPISDQSTFFFLQLANMIATYAIGLPGLVILFFDQLGHLANPPQMVISDPNTEHQYHVPFI